MEFPKMEGKLWKEKAVRGTSYRLSEHFEHV